MKLAILGYGKEGKSVEAFFKKIGAEIEIFDGFDGKKSAELPLADFDLVMRSPSVSPANKKWSSITKYFFDHCPAPIIGVTGTKGKGTTCSLITSILKALGKKVWLVGNIGIPALDVLEEIDENDVVVYELSSFQLWDIQQSPHVAVVLRIEPDHLNVHKDFDDYVSAKANITRFQKENDICVFYRENEKSKEIANYSVGEKIPYPAENQDLISGILDSLSLVGEHNRENANAAILAVAAFCGMSLEEFVARYSNEIKQGLHDFKGLPHRLELVRNLNGIKYYDDNYSTTLPALVVALNSFKSEPIVLIVGGRDKTNNEDIPNIIQTILDKKNIEKIILIGESGKEISSRVDDEKFVLAKSLDEAVAQAKKIAEKYPNAVVLMSPAAASFDMFRDVTDRGQQYQKLVLGL